MPLRAMDAHARFGETLRRLRIRKGLTQEDLAFRVGISVVYLSGLERGRRNPTLSIILGLAGALGVRPESLVRNLGDAHPQQRRPARG